MCYATKIYKYFAKNSLTAGGIIWLDFATTKKHGRAEEEHWQDMFCTKDQTFPFYNFKAPVQYLLVEC